jgi:NAD(P)-dependent dehydrogenase (short-subunit alcohol dehydrogenase family)
VSDGERRAIVVTGAASGIGRATALLFARRGWFTGLFDLDADGLAATAAALDGPSFQSRLDTTDLAAWRAALDAFGQASGGRLDVLFNCAGVLRVGWFEEMAPEAEAQMLRVNVLGTTTGIRAALPLLRRTPGACVVNMASSSIFYGVPEMAMYSASKAAVAALTEALDLELERLGIRVCDVAPPVVDTPLVRNQAQEATVYRTVRSRMTAETVAAAVWKAVHGRKLHWILAPGMGLLAAAVKLSPRLGRVLMKRLAIAP